MTQENLDIEEDNSFESSFEDVSSGNDFLSSSEEFEEKPRTRKKSLRSKSSDSKKSAAAKKPKATATRKVQAKPKAPDGKPSQVILDYIVKSHLPFTLILLYENLHRVYPKKEFERCLESLVKSGDLITKKCNKTLLWWPNSAKLSTEEITPTVINEITENNKKLEKDIQKLSNTIIAKEKEKRKLNAMMTLEDLKKGIESFKLENEDIGIKIKNIVESGNSITEETFNKEKDNFIKNFKTFKKYTNICNTMVESLSDEPNRKKCYKKLEVEYLENDLKEITEFSKTISK